MTDGFAAARERALQAHKPHGHPVPEHIALSIGDVRHVHTTWWTVVRRDEAETRRIIDTAGLTATLSPSDVPWATRVTVDFPQVMNRLEFAEFIRRLPSPADVRLHDARRWRPADV